MNLQPSSKIALLPTLLGLYLWIFAASEQTGPLHGSITVFSSESASSTVEESETILTRGNNPGVGPEALLVGIICSMGIHFTFRVQNSLQEHARSH
ncbi:MAG: hypothetical protein CBC13_10125 [Planctomycetia bacterium TMED53]|nr:MAG: hypothetical protein CBC13_10125 [Planctomycetia bacterium TMED53]